MDIFQANVLLVNGGREAINPADGAVFTVDEIESIIGSSFTAYPLLDGRVLVMSDMIEGVPQEVNLQASNLYREHSGVYFHVLYDALLCAPSQLGPWYAGDEDEPDDDTYYGV